jgi:cytidylate kinase
MYRAVTLALDRAGASVEDGDALEHVLANMDYEQRGDSFFLDGGDISAAIRSPGVTKLVSKVSADTRVRETLVSLQRRLGQVGSWVVDGRDIGTVVFPDARCKIFLHASPEARAQRRLLELRAKGVSTTFDEILVDQARRDEYDSTRAVSPLRMADNALELDSSLMSADEVSEWILAAFRQAAACRDQ